MFKENDYFPSDEQLERIERYRKNKLMFKGEHAKIFPLDTLSEPNRELVYVIANIPGLIVKKSADFLFGETPIYSAGKNDDSPEQKAIERHVTDNDLHILNYESAMGNGYRGDAFYKVRWGQKYGGLVSPELDPYRVFIELQKAGYVFMETLPGDDTVIYAYHIAVPKVIEGTADQDWVLDVESHYPGKIEYSKFKMRPISYSQYENTYTQWKISHRLSDDRKPVFTGVDSPLIVHVPNYSLDDELYGIDDLSENEPIFAEINNRLSKIAEILDKHSDPAMVVPAGTLGEDAAGNPIFHAGRDKIFESMGRDDVKPEYITWNGQLEAAFKELERLVDYLLMVSELPPVALGKTDAGTSGASGLSIKWRMNSLLAKINRKRQYYEKALKQVLVTAQKLEHAQSPKKPDYEITVPKIQFQDGLPNDDAEMATIAQIRTAGRATQSQLSAIMELHNYTEEQARIELERIREEEKQDSFVNSSIFNGDAE